MAEQQASSHNQPNNFFSFLSIIPKCLANPFGFGKNENGKSVKRVDGGESKGKNPDGVKFSLTQSQVPPLKHENEGAQDTKPLILWQVYALGGIFVLRWAWGKWQENKSKAKKDSTADDQPPTPVLAQTEDPTQTEYLASAPAQTEDSASAPAQPEDSAPAPAGDSSSVEAEAPSPGPDLAED